MCKRIIKFISKQKKVATSLSGTQSGGNKLSLAYSATRRDKALLTRRDSQRGYEKSIAVNFIFYFYTRSLSQCVEKADLDYAFVSTCPRLTVQRAFQRFVSWPRVKISETCQNCSSRRRFGWVPSANGWLLIKRWSKIDCSQCFLSSKANWYIEIKTSSEYLFLSRKVFSSDFGLAVYFKKENSFESVQRNAFRGMWKWIFG